MNKAKLLLLIVGLSLLSGSVCTYPATLRIPELLGAELYHLPDSYYHYSPVVLAGIDPRDWLDSDLEWAREYQPNLWDCSNMALYIEWVMENAGVPTKIALGYGHAWVLIWCPDKGEHGEWWAYECTSLHWVNPWNDGRYYHPLREFSSAHEMRDWYQPHNYAFVREWCWWADTDILWAYDDKET